MTDAADDDHIDVDDAANAVAAGEVVTASRGQPSPSLPEEVVAWVEQHGGSVRPELTALARSASGRVLRSSELQELWEESPSYFEWQTAVRELESRLAV